MRWAWFLAVAVLASGCHSNPPVDNPPDGATACIGSDGGEVCLADPTSPDATYVRETYGLEQLTNDQNDEQGNIRVDGDWIVWQISSSPRDTDIIAYNLVTKTLVPVEILPDVGSQRPYVHGGEVVFQRFSGEPFGYLAHWDSITGKVTHPETGLNGSTPYTFDGTWVGLQGVTNDGTQTGFFAWNMRDGRLIHLYTPLPDLKRPDGSYETMNGFDIYDGKAYYLLSLAKAAYTGYSAAIYEVDLETGEKRSWDFAHGGGTQMSVDANQVVFGSNLTIQLLDVSTGEFRKISQDDESGCGLPSIGRNLVVFGCSRPRFAAWAFDLVTGQRTELAGENLSAWQAVTDGHTVVVEALRNKPEHYETFYSDLYYKRL